MVAVSSSARQAFVYDVRTGQQKVVLEDASPVLSPGTFTDPEDWGTGQIVTRILIFRGIWACARQRRSLPAYNQQPISDIVFSILKCPEILVAVIAELLTATFILLKWTTAEFPQPLLQLFQVTFAAAG